MDKDRFYYNQKFLGGMSGRPLRILSEYLGPLSAFQKHNIKDTIVFFGSARLKGSNEYSILRFKSSVPIIKRRNR